jgi:anti-sigma B factor antagonist
MAREIYLLTSRGVPTHRNGELIYQQEEGSKMEISTKTAGDVNVIYLSGRLDAYAANDVERKLDSLITAGQVWLVVDLSRLEYISSSGLRVLLAGIKKVKKEQGDIRLACLQPYVKEVFDIAGFTQLFQMFDKEEDAVNSFKET